MKSIPRRSSERLVATSCLAFLFLHSANVLAWNVARISSVPLRQALSSPRQKYETQQVSPWGLRSSKGDRNDFLSSEDGSDEMQKSDDFSSVWPSDGDGKNMTAAYDDERQKRILNVRNKIELLLSGPDPPFDIETEMKKVTSIAPPSPPTQFLRPVDVRAEERVMQLEDEVEKAVMRQDFVTAAAAEEEISKMHIDDCGAVLQVNANYYRAFSTKQYADMQALWLKDGTAVCIHPSQQALVGSKAILHSWKRMFESSNGAFQKSWMEPHNIHLSVKGATTAVLTCDEHVYARRFIRGKRRETEVVNKLVATNIFRKCQGKWFLTYHHASWHSDSDAAKQALAVRGRGGGVSGSRRSSKNNNPSQGGGKQPINEEAAFQHWIGEQLLGGLGLDAQEEDYFNNEHDVDEEESDDPHAVDGILGIQNFGPLIGEGDGKNGKFKKPPNNVRSIDIFGPASGLGGLAGGGGPGNAFGKAIIRIDKSSLSKNGNQNNSNAFDFGDFAQEMMDEFDEVDERGEDDEASAHEQALEIRQSCVATLRKLHAMGAISPRQKRVLLTDMITCAGKGEVSLVEVAYQILFDFTEELSEEGEDQATTGVEAIRSVQKRIHKEEELDAVAHEEFAEQCRVIATSLLESQ